jgi:hypothetical protein
MSDRQSSNEDADDEGGSQASSDREETPYGGVCRPGVGGEVPNETGGGGESHERRGDTKSRQTDSDVGLLGRREVGSDAGPLEQMDEEIADAGEDPLAGPKRVETKLRWEGPGKIVYEPTLYQNGPEQYVVEAKREKRGLIPWGFWGGLLFVGVAFTVLAGAQSIYSFWDILWALVGLTVGALMYRYGRRSTVTEITLCEIDRRRGALHWPGGAQSGLEETLLSIEDVTEVVFGMTRLPVDESSTSARVDAFALLVRTSNDELIPVVEGSPYKGNVHEIAKFLADATDTDLTYVGRGIRR